MADKPEAPPNRKPLAAAMSSQQAQDFAKGAGLLYSPTPSPRYGQDMGGTNGQQMHDDAVARYAAQNGLPIPGKTGATGPIGGN